MNKEELIKKLEDWNRTETIKRGDKEILVFKNDEVFKIFGIENEVLNPFNDYTYEWLSAFFSDLQEFLEDNKGYLIELLDMFEEDIYEYIDGEVNVYTSDLTEWLAQNDNNVYYLTEALEEGVDDGFDALVIAQRKAIEEVYRRALEIIKEMVEGDPK